MKFMVFVTLTRTRIKWDSRKRYEPVMLLISINATRFKFISISESKINFKVNREPVGKIIQKWQILGKITQK